MTFQDIPFNPSSRALRQFSSAWLVFFLAIGGHQYLARGHHAAGVALGAAAFVIGALGLLKPGAVRWLFVGWMVLAFPIGCLVSQFMLLLMFYLIVTPVGFIFRLRGRDSLARKPMPDQASFWQSKRTPEDVRSYFRQY